MQEEVTRKTIALAIKTAKLDGKVLQAALRKLLQLYRKARNTPHHGKQTLKQLMRHGTGVSNIEITDANIKALPCTNGQSSTSPRTAILPMPQPEKTAAIFLHTTIQHDFMEVRIWHFSIAQLVFCRPS